MSGQFSLLITAAVPVIANYLQSSANERKQREKLHTSELEAAQAIFVRQSEGLSELHYYMLEVMFASIYGRQNPVATSGAEMDAGHQHLTMRRFEEDERTWVTYRSVLVAWKKQRLVATAATSRYFGAAAGKTLTSISDNLDILERQINAAHYRQTNSRFYIYDTQGEGARDDDNGVFLQLMREYIDQENFDFVDTDLYRRLSDEFKNDYRVKFLPVHRSVGEQISTFNTTMIEAVQKRDIGVLRGAGSR